MSEAASARWTYFARSNRTSPMKSMPEAGPKIRASCTYPLIERYVMTYTAFVPYEPKIAVAVSRDLQTWQRARRSSVR